MSRFTILLTMGIGVIVFVALVAFVSQDHDGAQAAKRDDNVRRARLANGLPERENDPSQAVPKAVATETSYDFGELAGDSGFSHTFTIRNEGNAPLELHVDKPSCTCVIAQAAKKLVNPGESTTLELSFRPDGKLANVMQGVRVSTNDPYRKQLQFQIIGQTKRLYWVDQPAIEFTDLQPEEERTVERRIYSIHEQGFEIEDLKIEPEGLTLRTEPLSPAELQEAQAKSGKKILITCPSTLKQLSEGALSFVVKKDETEKPVAYRLEVGGARLGRIGVMGDSLDPSGKIKFGQLLVGEGKQAVYTVKVRTKNRELKTRSIQTVPSMVHVSLEPVPGIDPSAGIYKMLVEVPKDSPEQSYMGKNHGNIHIEFEDENHPTLDLKLDFSIVKAKSIE